ncbi:MAG: trans-sulfuration enzyme family protein [Thermoanaerobaculia bacterium]
MPQPTESEAPSTHDLATLAIHGGLAPDPATGAILTPIYQSTTFVQESVGRHKGYTYSRTANPTVAALERNLGELEGALPAVCFASGMAALTTLFVATLDAGSHVVVGEVVYGGVVRLLEQVLSRFGVTASFVDSADARALEEAITPRTRLLLVESPGNPTLRLTDLAAAAAIARRAGVPLAVDNTLLTPALQRPLELGADIVVYSTTKYIEGHNATVGGALLTCDAELRERFRFHQNALGCGQSPFEAWLTLRGLKTLPLRMRRHSENALEIARFLAAHPAVERVLYPGLDDFPQAELARRQQATGGGMVAFEPRGGGAAAERFLAALTVWSLAENLGAAESLATHPETMTHSDVPEADRRRIGVTGGLIRLSVGLEEPADLIADLDQALARVAPVEAAR